MSGEFYRAFEDRFRGTRDSIKERLAIYLPFVEPLHLVYPEASAVDLGCGRGEWLEVLRARGIFATGVDLDEGMLRECHALSLNVEMRDAIAFLVSLPSDSQIVVSGFHLAEHLPFEVLQQLVGEALRVLRPGGVLILETPNPENITVGTSSFYLDPTHVRPLPPLLLSFLPEYCGFQRVKTVRVQEPLHLVADDAASLLDVIAGVSPDYAVIAQKAADDEILALTNDVFAKQYGLNLEALAKRFDAHFESGIQRAVDKAQHAKIVSQQAEAAAKQAEANAQQAEAVAQQAEAIAQQAEAVAQQAEAKAQQAETAAAHWQAQANEWHERLVAVHSSASWKITKPLRVIKRHLKGGVSILGSSAAIVKLELKKVMRSIASAGISFVLHRPVLRKTISPIMKIFPSLRQRMLRIAVNTGGGQSATPILAGGGSNAVGLDRYTADHGHRALGPAPDIDAILERIKVALEKTAG